MNPIEWTNDFISRNPILADLGPEQIRKSTGDFLAAIQRKTKLARLTASQTKRLGATFFEAGFAPALQSIIGVALKGMLLENNGVRVGFGERNMSFGELCLYRFTFEFPFVIARDCRLVSINYSFDELVLGSGTVYRNDPVIYRNGKASDIMSWQGMMSDLRNFDILLSKLNRAIALLFPGKPQTEMAMISELIDIARSVVAFLGAWPETKLIVTSSLPKAKEHRLRSALVNEDSAESFCRVCWRLTEFAVEKETGVVPKNTPSHTRCSVHVSARFPKAKRDLFLSYLLAINHIATLDSQFAEKFGSRDNDDQLVWNFFPIWLKAKIESSGLSSLPTVNLDNIRRRFLAFELSRIELSDIDLRIDIAEFQRSASKKLTQSQLAQQFGTTTRVVQRVLKEKGEIDFGAISAMLYAILKSKVSTEVLESTNPFKDIPSAWLQETTNQQFANRLRWLPSSLKKKLSDDSIYYLVNVIKSDFWRGALPHRALS